VCDTAYFGWLGSLRFSFPTEMLDPIRKAVFGFAGELKTYVKDGVVTVIEKVKSKVFGGEIKEVDPDTTNKEGPKPEGIPSPNVNIDDQQI